MGCYSVNTGVSKLKSVVLLLIHTSSSENCGMANAAVLVLDSFALSCILQIAVSKLSGLTLQPRSFFPK